MASPNEKASRLRHWPDLALFIAAAAFCALSGKMFFRAPAHAIVAQPKAARGLASVSHEQPAQERATRIFSFNCQDESIVRVKTEAHLFRLTAESCGGRIQSATNQSTGESLLLFERGNAVSTHYFPLKEGTNKILIEWKGSKKSQTIEVERS